MINECAKTNNVQPLLTLYILAVTEFVPRLGNFSQPVTRLRGCAEERELQTGTPCGSGTVTLALDRRAGQLHLLS